jgi:hypothetical protein
MGHYAAIEAIDDEYLFGSSIVRSTKTKSERWLRGTVLAKGPRVGEEVEVGDEVVYEMQSAHPGQRSPLDADMFGGTPGGACYLIPVYWRSLRGAAEIEREVERRLAAMKALSDLGDTRFLTHREAAEFGRHEKRLEELRELRKNAARGSRWDPLKNPGRGAGVVGLVEEKENGET